MKGIYFCLIVFPLIGFSFVSRASAADASDSFESRAKEYVARIAESPYSKNFSVITARIKSGKHLREAWAQLDSLLEHPTGDMFYTYTCIGCYLYLRNVLPDSTRQKFRNLWKTYTCYRGDTENHFLMYYSALLLASQTWNDMDGSQWFNGKSSLENHLEAQHWLLQWFDRTAHEGQIEFDSPRYMYFYYTPLFLLYQFTGDENIRVKAELMLDYLFADFAAEYLHGSYCGAHSRDAEASSIRPRTAEVMSYAALFFRDIDVPRPLPDVAYAALSSYRLPEIIRNLALVKPHGEIHQEVKRSRNHIRFGGAENPSVFKYDFITPDFCLGSMQGTIVQPIQQRSWALTFNSEKPTNQIFGLHPTYSAHELGTYFPEELAFSVAGVNKEKAGYASEDKWIGGSEYERIYQRHNVMIAIYDIPPDDPVGHIDIFIPNALDTVIHDADKTKGWIFVREGKAFAAIRPLCDYTMTTEGDHFRVRSAGRKNGYIVVGSSADLRPQIKTFEEFQTQILMSPLDTVGFSANEHVSFGYAERTPVEFSYNAKPEHDSALFDDSVFGSLRRSADPAPRMHAKRYSGIITIENDVQELVLNFNSNSVHLKAIKEDEKDND